MNNCNLPISQRNPSNPEHWGPSVYYDRQILVPNGDNVAEIEIGQKHQGGIVTSVKFSNQGVNSSVKVGRNSRFETIPRSGAAEISFGEGFPIHIEDKFSVVFEASGGIPQHLCIVIIAVVNFKN